MSWSMPAELDQAAPRRTQIKVAFRVAIIVGVAALWALAALAVLGVFLDCHAAERLGASGVDTVAVVIDARVSAQHRGGGQRYVVTYIFVPQTQTSLSRSYTGDAGVSAAEFNALPVGQPVPVTYDPHSPSFSRLKLDLDGRLAHPYDAVLHAVQLVLVVFGALTVVPLGVARVAYVRERRLARWGSVASATIVGERQVSSGRQRYTQVTYQFFDENGVLVTGRRSSLPSRRMLEAGYDQVIYSAWHAVFDNPTVIYDPANSSRNLLYPPVMVKCVG